MSIWKDPAPTKRDTPPPLTDPAPTPVRDATPAAADFSPTVTPPGLRPTTSAPATATTPAMNESLIAADLTIEGKIEGAGHIRIAGKFKGDVNVQGDLTIETGAKLSGGVRAKKVVIAGELEGNIESAARVELLASGVLIGDVKAGSLTVAAGSRMRGQAEFGWDDGKASVAATPAKASSAGNAATETSTATVSETAKA
jgi:cytoskeletal protein CcmA (bactofilin family)